MNDFIEIFSSCHDKGINKNGSSNDETNFISYFQGKKIYMLPGLNFGKNSFYRVQYLS